MFASNRNIRMLVFAFFLLIFYLGQATTLFASSIAVTAPTSFLEGGSDGTWGWQFKSSQDITVTALGAFDKNGDGLSASTPVGLWDENRNLLGSVTVAAGASDPLESGYRWVDLSTSANLLANTYYRIGSFLTLDNAIYSGSGHVFNPLIFYSRAVYRYKYENENEELHYPYYLTIDSYKSKYFNASFKFVVTDEYVVTEPVPEPATMLLLGTGLVGVAGAARRRKKK